MSLKLGNTNIAGTQVLYSTTGNNTDGAMTQNATTTELNNCVHKTGNETISGNKTFSGFGTFTNYNAFWKTPYNIIVRSESIENGVTPSSNQYMGIEFRDKNDVRVGWIGLTTKTDGRQQIELQKLGSTSGFTAPTPSVGDNSNQIATTAWVNNLNNNVVHKTGNETISGNKIFTNNIDRYVDAIRGQIPSADSYSDIRFADNNNKWLAGFEYALHQNKSSALGIFLSDSVSDTTNIKVAIELGLNTDGTVYTTAQTPSVSSNSSDIATTAYVNTKFQVVSTLPANPNGNVYYFIPE